MKVLSHLFTRKHAQIMFFFDHVILILDKLKADEAWYAGRRCKALFISKSDMRQ